MQTHTQFRFHREKFFVTKRKIPKERKKDLLLFSKKNPFDFLVMYS